MKKAIYLTLFTVLLLTPLFSINANLGDSLRGKILLQVEGVGQAWYVDPGTKERAFLGRPEDAFRIMRELGLGVSEANYNSFNGYAPDNLSGKILLRVEANGEAYYVQPDDLKMHYLGRPADAFRIMREQGLGITNNNLEQIQIFQKYSEEKAEEDNTLTEMQKQLEEQAKLIQELQDLNTQKQLEDSLEPLEGSEIYQQVSPAVVYISNSPGGKRGTGMIIDDNGYILTNAHVVQDANSVNIITSDGKSYIGRITGRDEKLDIALIKINPITSNDSFYFVSLGDSDLVSNLDDIYILGYPLGVYGEVRSKKGGVSSRLEYSGINYIEYTPGGLSGNSGGPIANEYGYVVGIVTMAVGSTEEEIESGNAFNLAIPINLAKEYLSKLKTGWLVINPSWHSDSTPNYTEITEYNYSDYNPDIELYYDESGHRYVVEFKDQSERDIRIKKMVISLPETWDGFSPYFNTSWDSSAKSFDKEDNNEYVFVREEISIDPPDSVYIYGANNITIDLSNWIIWDYTDDKQVNPDYL